MKKWILILTVLATGICFSQSSRQNISMMKLDTLYFKGTDTARVLIKDNNLTFQYYKAASYDSVHLRTLGPISAREFPKAGFDNAIITIGSPTGGGGITIPADTGRLIAGQLRMKGCLIKPGGGVTVIVQCYIKNAYTGDSTWTSIGFWDLSIPFSYPNDTLVTGNYTIDFTHYSYLTFVNGFVGYPASYHTYGMTPSKNMPLRIQFYYAKANPYSVPIQALGDSANPAFILWIPGFQFVTPGSWQTSGYFERDNFAVTTNLTVGGNATIEGNLTNDGTTTAQALIGLDGVRAGDPADSSGGSLSVVDTLGHTASIVAYLTANRSFALGDTGGYLVTEARLQALISGIRSYITCPADKPPDSPNSYDDEFNTSPIDTTTRWKTRNWGTSTVEALNGLCVLSDSGGAGGALVMLEQNLAADDTIWNITVKLSSANRLLDYFQTGVFGLDTASNRAITWGFSSGTGFKLDANHWILGGACTNVATRLMNEGDYYFKLARGNGYLACYFSVDGIVWSLFYSEATGSYVENSGLINKIGIYVHRNRAAGLKVSAGFWWLRRDWICDYDPQTDY